jgi:hypothetical protein
MEEDDYGDDVKTPNVVRKVQKYRALYIKA